MSLTTIKIKVLPDGTLQEEVLGVSGHECQKVTEPLEAALGTVARREHTSEFFKATDPNPSEKWLVELEQEDWRGCCDGFMCEFGL